LQWLVRFQILSPRHARGQARGPPAKLAAKARCPVSFTAAAQTPQPIQIPFNVLLKHLKDGRFMSTLFNLKVEGQEDVRVICRGVQRDVVKDLPTHVDLMRLRRTSKVNLFIPSSSSMRRPRPASSVAAF
jgi:large subunit ribosomal protein L25